MGRRLMNYLEQWSVLLKGQYGLGIEPLIDVIVHPDGKPEHFRPVLGLLDTGADYGVISMELAHQLGLRPIGIECMRTAFGTGWCPVFAATVVLPSVETRHQRSFAGQRLLGGNLTHHSFDLLVGRSILQQGVLFMAGETFFFWIDADIPTLMW